MVNGAKEAVEREETRVVYAMNSRNNLAWSQVYIYLEKRHGIEIGRVGRANLYLVHFSWSGGDKYWMILQAGRARSRGPLPATQDMAQAAHTRLETPVLLPMMLWGTWRVQTCELSPLQDMPATVFIWEQASSGCQITVTGMSGRF